MKYLILMMVLIVNSPVIADTRIQADTCDGNVTQLDVMSDGTVQFSTDLKQKQIIAPTRVSPLLVSMLALSFAAHKNISTGRDGQGNVVALNFGACTSDLLKLKSK